VQRSEGDFLETSTLTTVEDEGLICRLLDYSEELRGRRAAVRHRSGKPEEAAAA